MSALETVTHEIINEFIVKENVGFSLDSYLTQQLGFSKGIKEEFKSQAGSFKREETKTVAKWIAKGGEWEDKPPGALPYTRSFNHYLDPVNNQGYSNIFLIPFWWIEQPWDSALQWFQRDTGTQGRGFYSWNDVREYFHNALTSADKATREDAFADTFRGLGQLMHLIEDMSVPEHTRNDGHVVYNYEIWVKKNIEKADEIKKFSPVFFEASAIRKIADLFDTDQYHGTNPEVIAPGNRTGLAEYSNANFFSEGTIYGSDFAYPYRSDNTEVSTIPDPRDPDREAFREYHLWNDGYEPEDYRLALTSFVTTYWTKAGNEEHELDLPANLDEYVYKDYAERLIPRAVGYASEVPKYFFRGRMEITNVFPELTAASEEGFGRMTVSARNISQPGEDMTGGTLTLVIKYRAAQGNRFRTDANHPYPDDEFHYIVKEKACSPAKCTVPRTDSADFVFDLPDRQLPLWAAETEIFLVYRGTLGTEEETAVAVGYTQHVIPGIGITLPDTGFYAQISGDEYENNSSYDASEKGFAHVTMLARNLSPEGGSLADGKLTFVAKYRISQGNPFQSPVPATSAEFSYIIKETEAIPIPPDQPAEVTADLNGQNIPLYATDLHTWLVYEGTDGSGNRITAAGYRDISEPTPADIWNLTDRIDIIGNKEILAG